MLTKCNKLTFNKLYREDTSAKLTLQKMQYISRTKIGGIYE